MLDKPTERIFNPGGATAMTLSGDANTADEKSDVYLNTIRTMMEDSVAYEEDYLSGQRDTHQKYYYGQLPSIDGAADSDEIWGDPPVYDGDMENPNAVNKSTVVSTDVRDAILTILPSLIRIFAASENPIDLVPRKPQDTEMAKQATEYVNYVFWNDNDGFLTLHSVFKDALGNKGGFVKWWSDTTPEFVEKSYVNVTFEQFQLLVNDNPEMEVVDVQGDPGSGLAKTLTIKFPKSKPLTKIAPVPPEEMRIDRYANTFKTSRICGHERAVPMSDLTALGYTPEELEGYLTGSSGVSTNSDERTIRNGGDDDSNPLGDNVIYGEWYIRVDQDEDGVAELRYICTIGEERHVISDEPANRIKFAYFSADPRPHTIVGDDIADLAIDVQRIKTNLLRGILDSLAESINPKTVINELTTNLDDALNDDLGAVIRTRGDPNAAVAFSTTPFVGRDALPVLDSLDMLLSRRTGLSDAAKGLDPKALQSSTQLGVDAIISGAQERIELIARILAETGYKDMFKGIYDEICENPNQKRTLQLRGTWKEYNVSLFDPSMDVIINPTMGKGSDIMRMQTLTQIKQDQMTIIEKFGINNPMVSPVEVYNTLTDQLALANIRDPSRYFKPVTPEIMAQIAAQPSEPDPMAVAAKAQFEEVRRKTAEGVNKKIADQDKLAQTAEEKERDRQAKLDIADANNATQLTIAKMAEDTKRIAAITKDNNEGSE